MIYVLLVDHMVWAHAFDMPLHKSKKCLSIHLQQQDSQTSPYNAIAKASIAYVLLHLSKFSVAVFVVNMGCHGVSGDY